MPFSLLAEGINKTIDLPFMFYDNWQEDQLRASQEKIAQQQLALAEKEYYSNVDIMNKNFGLQQQAFNYNKQQAELTRMREDNAFQRRVADTVKAGFSPLATEGVASASQSPTLTAPQLDPQGVNQATQNRLSAYQNKMNQNNQNAQLRLQSQQLKLAQIETLTETISAVQNLRSQNIVNQRNLHEIDWYKKHGYRDTTLNTILSDILKGVNYNGKSLGQLGADGINYALDKVLNNPKNIKKFGTGSAFLSNLNKLGGFKSSNSNPIKEGTTKTDRQLRSRLSNIEKTFFGQDNAKNLRKADILNLRAFAKDIGWRGVDDILPEDAKKVSQNQFYMLKSSFYKYLEEINKQGWF